MCITYPLNPSLCFLNKKAMLGLIILLLIFSAPVAAQKTEVYRTIAGQSFSRRQKDSLERIGKFVGIKDKQETADSIYYNIFYYDKSLLLTAHQKKLHGKPLPDFRLASLAGEVIDSKKLRGKPVVINFWSTDCGPCIAEFEQLNQLKAKYGNDVHFIGIAPESALKVKRLISKFVLDFTIIPNGGRYMKKLGVESNPQNFFITGNGVIELVEEGIPFDAKRTPEGRPRDGSGPYKILVFENYSPVIEKLIQQTL